MALRVYNFFVPFLLLVARALTAFIPKLDSTLRERDGVLDRWRAGMVGKANPRILFHVASVGELEQVMPVLEEWRKRESAVFLLSFFSPSVRQVCRDFSFVDFADYLPLDTQRETREFFDIVAPDYIVLNRYDIWPNLVAEARARGVPIALVNASTPPLGFFGQISLSLRDFLFREVTAWTYVDGMAAGAWEPYLGRGAAALVAGNPRVDRAVSRVLNSGRSREIISRIQAGWKFDTERTIVAGSTWAPDENLVLGALAKIRKESGFTSTKAILVPHEPNPENIKSLERLVRSHGLSSVLLSRLPAVDTKDQPPPRAEDILIIDRVGVLAEIYALGNTTFVGGGFGRSVHSVIEPAAHGLPVAFGTQHQRMPEARTIQLMGGATCIASSEDYDELAHWFQDTLRGGKNFQKARDAVDLFIKMNSGAGERIAQFLEEQLQRKKRGATEPEGEMK